MSDHNARTQLALGAVQLVRKQRQLSLAARAAKEAALKEIDLAAASELRTQKKEALASQYAQASEKVKSGRQMTIFTLSCTVNLSQQREIQSEMLEITDQIDDLNETQRLARALGLKYDIKHTLFVDLARNAAALEGTVMADQSEEI
jgi:hypothetical protein